MAIQKADGTLVTQTAYLAAHTTNVQPSTYTVPYDIYETSFVTGQPYTSTRPKARRLKYRQGTVITQAQLDALYLEATVPGVLSPVSGTTAGGTVVTITGTNLTDTTGVTFGGTAGTALKILSDTQIQITTPAKGAGAVTVVIQNPTGDVTKATAYTFV